ncbi:hypothetical protein [Glutamicibacter creatinolyticus]|uniref:hypothetical protein n=1 Tax=Glutamicibacter creatinolyticus TaxID=162496 RepID=UPI001C2FF54C|nr:hypothetical protein [Glutamicibacter creatinolyticus]
MGTLVAALALAGCTAGNESAESTPSPTATISASDTTSASPDESFEASAKKTATPNDGKAWADKMINLFLNGNSKSKFSDFSKEIPHHYITEWGQESKGVMSVTVSGKNWNQCDLDELAVTVMSTAGHETPEMKKVVTYSGTKGLVGATGRDGMNFGTPSSC